MKSKKSHENWSEVYLDKIEFTLPFFIEIGSSYCFWKFPGHFPKDFPEKLKIWWKEMKIPISNKVWPTQMFSLFLGQTTSF